MNLPPKQLKATAIPSLNLLEPKETDEETARSKRHRKKVESQLVESLMKPSTSSETETTLPSMSVASPSYNEREVLDISDMALAEETSVKDELNKIRQENENLKKSLEEAELTVKQLAEKNAQLVKLVENHNFGFTNKVKEAFSHFLTSNQVDIFLKKKTRARWTNEEISKAFTLRYLSKRAYIYIRQKWGCPLPGLSTLQQWVKDMNLMEGVLGCVLTIMEVSSKNFTNQELVTILSFDEIKVSSLYEYDKKNNNIVGPHNYLQVVMARGLFASWKPGI